MKWHNIGTSQKRTKDDFERYLNRKLEDKKVLIIAGKVVTKKFGTKIRQLDSKHFEKEFKKWSKNKTPKK